jgi:archaellum component FlaC
MKNLLLALAGTLMLSASTNAQSFSIDIVTDDYSCYEYYWSTQSSNQNGDVLSVQISGGGPANNVCNLPSSINMNIDFSTGEISIPDVGITAGCEDLDASYSDPSYMIRYDVPGWAIFIYPYDTNFSLELLAPCYNECEECEECPADLSDELSAVEAQLDACQSVNAGLSDAVSAQGAQINDLQATIDSLEAVNTALTNANNVLQDNLATVSDNLVSMTEARDTYYDLWIDCQGDLEDCGNELNAADGIIDNLSDENADLAADLYECQTTLTVVQGQADNCAEMYQDYQLFYVQTVNTLNGEIGDLEDDLDACEAVNDSLLNDLADLTVDLVNMTAESDTCFMEYSALDDQFIDAVNEYEGIIDNLNTQLDELADQSVTIIANLQDQLDDCTATSESLAAQLDDCETAGIAIVSELQNQLLACEGQLTDAQEAASACSAAIETAADNAYAQGLEDCADAANAACLELLNDAYDGGFTDGLEECEANNAGELLTVFQNGYDAGLADCDEVSGLVDIDGTVINVIGYYNQLGQVIDPATATGVIIRRHEDGTFSKYIKTLR